MNKFIFALMVAVALPTFTFGASDTYNSKVGIEQGGERGFVKSGGSFDVESGGEIDIESGGALKIGGTAVSASAAVINGMDARVTAIETLADGKIYLGNGSNVATEVTPSGQATMDNAGVITLANASVIAKVLTGYSAGAGTVSATDSILQAIQKVDGNSSNASVIARLLTAYSAGTQGSVSAISASDSILAAIQKLDGNKPDYVEAAPSLTFGGGVGAKSVAVRKVGKLVTLHIPAGSTADPGAATIASDAVDAAYRPAAAVTFQVVVIDNSTRKSGQVVVGSDGLVTFSVLGANFTDDQPAGWDATAVTFAVP